MSIPAELRLYVGRVRDFTKQDVRVYVAWVGLMCGLVVATGGFLCFGATFGVEFPAAAWWVPSGAAIFALSIALDTIGHRTIYKSAIAGAEGLVHGVTIFCGIGSSVLLCVAYSQREAVWIPALVLTVLSFFYSVVDEAFHWQRYVRGRSDAVEMWSHLGILVGHGTMMLGWWTWFWGGYVGVSETLALLP